MDRFRDQLTRFADGLTFEGMEGLAPLLADMPPARLFEEVCKLFLTGHALRSFEALQRGISVLMNDVEGRAIMELGRR